MSISISDSQPPPRDKLPLLTFPELRILRDPPLLPHTLPLRFKSIFVSWSALQGRQIERSHYVWVLHNARVVAAQHRATCLRHASVLPNKHHKICLRAGSTCMRLYCPSTTRFPWKRDFPLTALLSPQYRYSLVARSWPQYDRYLPLYARGQVPIEDQGRRPILYTDRTRTGCEDHLPATSKQGLSLRA